MVQEKRRFYEHRKEELETPGETMRRRTKDLIKVFFIFVAVRIVMIDSGMRFVNLPGIDHVLVAVAEHVHALLDPISKFHWHF